MGRPRKTEGPTIRDLKAAGLDSAYDALMEIGKDRRKAFKSSQASQSALGSSVFSFGQAQSASPSSGPRSAAPSTSTPSASPSRGAAAWARARSKVSSFLTVASSRFRNLRQMATTALEDIYEDEAGVTRESKFGGRAYQMAAEAMVNDEVHAELTKITLRMRRCVAGPASG